MKTSNLLKLLLIKAFTFLFFSYPCFAQITRYITHETETGAMAIPGCTEITGSLHLINNFSEAKTINGYVYYYPNNFEYVDKVDFPNAPTQFSTVNGIAYKFETEEITLQPEERRVYEFKVRIVEERNYGGSEVYLFSGHKYAGINYDGPIHDFSYSQYRPVIGDVKLSELLDDPNTYTLKEKCAACADDTPGCPNQNSQQLIYLNGNLEIDEDYCIMGVDAQEVNLSRVLIMPGSSITVTNGATLRLKDVRFYSCDNMWKGITVEDGKLLCNNAFFNDAQYAIELKDGTEASFGGCTFTDNYVGLYMPPNNGTPQSTNINTFHNNLFIGTGSMKEPYSGQSPSVQDIPYAGVLANDVASLNLNGTGSGTSMIIVNEFTNLANGIIAKKTNLSVINGIFTDMKKLPFPNSYNPQGIGIFMDGNAHSLIQRGISSPSFLDPTFSNCGTAIVSWRCDLDISENLMEEVNTGVFSTLAQNRTIDIYDNYIKADKYGMNLYYNTPLSGTIADNIIEIKGEGNPDLNYGIRANELISVPSGQNGGWLIENNRIDQFSATHGIYYRGGSFGSITNNTLYWFDERWNPYIGITIENSVGMEVTCNSIIGNADFSNSSDPNYRQGRGIVLRSAPNNNLSCNEITHSNIGIGIIGMCTMEDMLSGNNLGECFYGLQLGSFEDNGNAFCGKQTHRGNLWTGTYLSSTGAYGAKHWSSSSNVIGQSKFYVNGNVTDALPTSDPTSGWFINQTSGNPTTYDCSTENTCPDGIGWHPMFVDPDDELIIKIAKDSVVSTIDNEVFNWTGARQLYKKLEANPLVMSFDTLMQQFYTNNGSNSVGAFFEIDTSLQNVYLPSNPLIDSLNATNAIIRQKFNEIFVLDSLLSSSPSENDSLSYVHDRDSLINYIEVKDNTRSSLVGQLTTQQSTKMAAIELDNSAISGTEVYIANQRTVNDIILNVMPAADFALDSTQLADLESIAWQCPWSGGDAVFQARGLLSFVQDTVYDDSTLCLNQQYRIKKEEIENEAFVVYPNPASDRVTVQLDGNSTRQLEVYNALGQVLFSALVDQEKTLSINTANWTSGLYYCILQDKNGKKSSASFVISK